VEHSPSVLRGSWVRVPHGSPISSSFRDDEDAVVRSLIDWARKSAVWRDSIVLDHDVVAPSPATFEKRSETK